MNKKGQNFGFAIIVAVMIFLVGMISVNFLKGEVTNARSISNLNCADYNNISDATKLTCLTVDWVVPYFIILIVSIAGGAITAKLTL